MAERLFGVETEYAITRLGGQNRGELVEQILATASRQLAHLPDIGSHGLYLQNGARFYIDCGLHPEMATPECANPWDIVRYVQAGEWMIEQVLSRLPPKARAAGEVMCFRCNVDYASAGVTWGCHESYLHRTDPGALPGQIIPHLVSRIVYTGAGGFNPSAPGIEFTLSPRMDHMVQVVSNDSTSNRGIFHTKDEALCGHGYHRLHVLCGESLCSETATWLKAGATALVVAMIDAGLEPGAAVALEKPLKALRAVAADPGCGTLLRLKDGRSISAPAIQRHYLAQAEAHARDPFMPLWAPEVCRRWRAVLDLLEGAPESAERTLDWAIKRSLYGQWVRRRGFRWDSLPDWNSVIARLNAALDGTEHRGKTVSVQFVLAPDSPVRDEVARLTPFLEEKGLRWEEMKAFLDLRRELCEADTRFGQLGEKGIFRALDRAGVLSHRVPGVDNIEHAVANPPSIGRARVRGEVVRRLAGNGQCLCEWQQVWDCAGKRRLDLSDPFAAGEQWTDLPEPFAEEVLGSRFRLRPWLDACLADRPRGGRGA